MTSTIFSAINSTEDLRDLPLDYAASIELIWTLYCSAVSSYRSDTLIRPFPPQFLNEDGEKDIAALKAVVQSLPSINDISLGNTRLTTSHSDLMDWLLKSLKISLLPMDIADVSRLKEKTGETSAAPIPIPTHLFEVQYSDNNNTAFLDRQGDRKLLYAYHGSKVENFYSILTHGLHSHLNKTSLFGEGTYLSVEPSVAIGFSPWGKNSWEKSALGDPMSIVALCEVIDDPSVKRSTSSSIGGRRAPNSLAGDIPDNYIVVTNNDMVRVKYLFVYAKKTASSKTRRPQRSLWDSGLQWIHRAGFLFPVLFYGLILIFISIVSSKKFWIKVKHLYEELFDA